MIDIGAIERQLAHKTHGHSRRLQILERTRQRLKDGEIASRAEIAKQTALLAQAELAHAELDRLQEEYGSNRRTGATSGGGRGETVTVFDPDVVMKNFAAVGLQYDGGAVVLDSSFPFERSADGFLVKNPLEAAGECRPFTPYKVDLAKLRADQAERALMIPGYASLCHMAQMQWLDRSILDEAVERAIRWRIVGHTNAPDLAGYIVQGSALDGSDKAKAFWAERRKRLDAVGHREPDYE